MSHLNRFSLKTLLLLTVAIASILGMIVAKRKLSESRDVAAQLASENAQYVGELSVENPTVPQVVAVPDSIENSLRWRWRIYLPDDRRYRGHVLDYSIPEDGDFSRPIPSFYDGGRLEKQSYRFAFQQAGELVVDFAIVNRLSTPSSTDWQFTVAVDGETVSAGLLSTFEPEEDFDLQLGSHKTNAQAWSVGNPIPLLVARYLETQRKDRPGTVPGFALVIEDLGVAPSKNSQTNR